MQIRQSAYQYAMQYIRDEEYAFKSIAFHLLAELKGYSDSVYFHYGDILTGLSLWVRQIWSESLGKDGFGTTPIIAEEL